MLLFKCTHLVPQWLENLTLLQMWPLLDTSSHCVILIPPINPDFGHHFVAFNVI